MLKCRVVYSLVIVCLAMVFYGIGKADRFVDRFPLTAALFAIALVATFLALIFPRSEVCWFMSGIAVSSAFFWRAVSLIFIELSPDRSFYDRPGAIWVAMGNYIMTLLGITVLYRHQLRPRGENCDDA